MVVAFLLGLGGMVMTVLTLSAAIEGWHGGPIGWWERAILLVLGVLNIVQEPLMVFSYYANGYSGRLHAPIH
jgi:TRAP-type uncharacterized transport system fused permease subunit